MNNKQLLLTFESEELKDNFKDSIDSKSVWYEAELCIEKLEDSKGVKKLR